MTALLRWLLLVLPILPSSAVPSNVSSCIIDNAQQWLSPPGTWENITSEKLQGEAKDYSYVRRTALIMLFMILVSIFMIAVKGCEDFAPYISSGVVKLQNLRDGTATTQYDPAVVRRVDEMLWQVHRVIAACVFGICFFFVFKVYRLLRVCYWGARRLSSSPC